MHVLTMFHSNLRKPRPLGSVYSITGPLQIKQLNLPRVLPGISADTGKFEEGIQGSALAVPIHPNPGKDSAPPVICGKVQPDESLRLSSKMVPDSTVCHDNCKKKINESLIREKELKNQNELLSRQLEQLKVTLYRKEEDIKLLEGQIAKQETQYTAQLSEERSNHETTKITLAETRKKIGEAHKRLESVVDDHKDEIRRQKDESEIHLMERLADKDSTIADRDQKISRLKLQMADALKGNSWERQKQLDELTKELSRLHDECDMLRTKLKSVSMNKQVQCSSCEENSVKVQQLQATIKDRNVTIRELESLCSKLETQLSTQDKLLEQWALSKGQTISAPK